MAVIIEGCDLTGKTTLAKSLNWPIMTKELGGRGRVTLDSCMRLYVGYTLWVRWWITEYIYDSVLRMNYVCTELDMFKFKLLSDVYGAVMIHLWCSLPELEKRHKVRGDTHSLEYLAQIHKGYDSFMKHFTPYLPPIFDKQHLDDALILHHQLQKRSERWIGFDVDGWGSLDEGKIVLIGEKINPTSHAKLPFAFKTNKGCGRYFMTALHKAGVKPSDIHVMNLWHKNDSQGDWQGVLNLLVPKRVIALGSKVSKALTKEGVKHNTIYHPQHWKRFHYHEMDKYVTSIIEAI